MSADLVGLLGVLRTKVGRVNSTGPAYLEPGRQLAKSTASIISIHFNFDQRRCP